MKYNDINKIHYFLWMISADVQASRCTVCLSSLSHLPVRFSFHLSRLHGIKITQRKAENQIKMAKMIMMNELNKRANLLIEQLEVITFFPRFSSPSFCAIPNVFISKHPADDGCTGDGACGTERLQSESCKIGRFRQVVTYSNRWGSWEKCWGDPCFCRCLPVQSISSDFKQRLEDQLQGAIELCSQLEHVQNFITWATAHHRRNPLLFSKELVGFSPRPSGL